MTKPSPQRGGLSGELRRVLFGVRRRWRLLGLFAMIGLFAGWLHVKTTPPQYTSTTTMFLSLSSGQTASELAQGSIYTQGLVQTYAKVATSPVVLAPVIAELHLDTTPAKLAESISVKAPLNTVLLGVSVKQRSPARAQAIASRVAKHLAQAVESLSPKAKTGDPLTVSVIAPATTPSAPSSPNRELSLGLGLFLGLVAGLGIGMVRETLGGALSDREAVAEITPTPVVGMIPWARRGSRSSAVPGARSTSELSEAHRVLRTNLHFIRQGRPSQHIVVTSGSAGEGKTTTSIDLALVLAEAGERVLLIDADLRRPRVADVLNLEGAAGLSTILTGGARWEELVQHWGPDDLHVITSGVVPPNPSELLGSESMAALLDSARSRYDVVIIDSAPLLPVTDTAVIASKADGVLVVVNARKTPPRHLSESLEMVRLSGGRVIGIALNGTRPRKSAYYGASPSRRRLRGRAAWVMAGTSMSSREHGDRSAVGQGESSWQRGFSGSGSASASQPSLETDQSLQLSLPWR